MPFLWLVHALGPFRALNCSINWMQSSFTAQELGAYLQGTIQIRRETPALTTLPVSFQGSLAITALQRAFPGHYLTASTMPPATTDTALFKLVRPPLALPV